MLKVMLLRNDEVNEDGEWSLKVFSKYGIRRKKKSFEFIKKLLLTKFPTYFFKYKDRQSTW